MLQIAVCENINETESGIADLVERYLVEHGVEAAPVIRTSSALDLLERIVRPGQESFVDVLVAEEDLPGLSGVELLREVCNVDCGVAKVLVADSAAASYEAIAAGAQGFVLKPVTYESLEKALDQVIPKVATRCEASLEMRFRDCARRVHPSEIVYAETAGHDQVVHLTDGSAHALRSSSQALFDRLSHDGRFFKNGSSYIVNLNHVICLSSDGYATMSSGAVATVPVRLRKQFEEALMA